MELKIEKLKTKDGSVVDVVNQYIVMMHDDAVNRADVKEPKRKVILTIEESEDKDGEFCVDAIVDIKLPGRHPKLRFRFKGEIRKDANGLQMIFPGMEKQAS